ncbi:MULTISPECIES: hypothetical protein [Vibrio]|uniref:DNAase n=1 Tax=Vibrio campbellii TaxID=680 RepID=A0AAQ3AZD1_9VIBR|nr:MULTISPECIES: hypothetical protein [Vibrio]AQW60517.1 DNAase [Vibrio owensii]AUV88524.1 DNAase [Vibrio campbellii]WDG06860.1 DNAase [Vibrio campbellii]CAD7825489.1 hypothetical protein ACOMICROBIO_NCLOACGD_04758 [Vibrio sp. B1ASS3]CAE6957128.1 hypothetical protein ACOMICROBIO_NCLOACGD_04758 [Vibrio sp. B1ASS3]
MEKEVIQVMTHSARALGELKPAFRAVPNEYKELCKAVKEGRVSLYRLTSDKCDLLIAGERDGDSYYLWAVVGHGLASGIKQLCKTVKAAGIGSLVADTAFEGVARLVRRLGVTQKHDGDFIRLDLEGF